MAIVDYNDDLASDFSIITKNTDDIISEAFKDENEKLLAKSIIENLEKDAVEGIKRGLTIKIPRIGNYRYNPIRKRIAEHYKDFKQARKSMTKEEYKEYVGGSIDKWKEEERNKNFDKLKVKRYRSRFKKQYEYRALRFGILYASLWFRFLLEVKPVEFDIELERHLQYLYGNKSS